MVFFHATTKLLFAELDGVYVGRRELAFVLLGFWSHFFGAELVRHPKLDIRKGNRDLLSAQQMINLRMAVRGNEMNRYK